MREIPLLRLFPSLFQFLPFLAIPTQEDRAGNKRNKGT